NKLNLFMFKKQLNPIRKIKAFNNPIIWVTLPTAYPLLSQFKTCPIIYYCCDDYSVLTESLNSQIRICEDKLIKKASLILVVSSTLASMMPENKTLILDHAIDVELFSKPQERPKDLPEGKPIAGFYGSLSHWVDFDLIHQCATALNNWNFVLIGPKSVGFERLEQLSNVFYLGAKNYMELPGYSQHWDVGLIPFVKNQLSDACNPLKVKEYLATGKPVISIDIPALRIYKDYIHIAKDPQDFIKAIPLSLQDSNAQARKNLVKDQSWDNRALFLEEKLLGLDS
ncbi:MAG: glycosyltransferase, partial [Legionellales bacterium]